MSYDVSLNRCTITNVLNTWRLSHLNVKGKRLEILQIHNDGILYHIAPVCTTNNLPRIVQTHAEHLLINGNVKNALKN